MSTVKGIAYTGLAILCIVLVFCLISLPYLFMGHLVLGVP